MNYSLTAKGNLWYSLIEFDTFINKKLCISRINRGFLWYFYDKIKSLGEWIEYSPSKYMENIRENFDTKQMITFFGNVIEGMEDTPVNRFLMNLICNVVRFDELNDEMENVVYVTPL